MGLNAAGPLSIGGNTVGESINLELGLAPYRPSNLNEYPFRYFVGIDEPNEIALSDFYGSLSPPIITRTGQYSTTSWETGISFTVNNSNLSEYQGKTCRLVFKYVRGTSFTGDIQIDNVRILQGLTTTTYSFENNAEGWETTTLDNTGKEYYQITDWTTLATGTTVQRWNMRTGGTPSASTGLSFATNGSYYVYAETSVSGSSPTTFWLRSPQFNTGFSGTGILFDCARYGATIGTLEVFLEVIRTRRGTEYGRKADPNLSPPLVTRTGQYSTTSWESGISLGNLSAYAGKTVRIAFKYISGTSFTGDIQIDNVRRTLNGTLTINSFESSNDGWETTTVDVGSNTSYGNITGWTSVLTATTELRWNRRSGSTPSGSTGLNSASDGSFYLYAETSGSAFPEKTMWLRSPQFTIPSSGTSTITFDCGRYGATIGTLEAYLHIVS